jgi:hypothetical protein
MTTKRINRLVNTFLATGPKDISIKAFDKFLKAQGESYKFNDLPQSFLKPFIHHGYYVPSGNSIYPIKEYLEQGQFVIELTGPERHGEYLLAGTRFLWMTDWLKTGKPITLVDSMGNEIPPKPKQAYIKNIKQAYTFTSFYELLELLLEEKEENDPILNIQDPDKDPDELMVHVTCWDLKPFRKTTKTPLSEFLTVTLIDHKKGVFQLDGYLINRTKTTFSVEEMIDRYVITMDKALHQVLTQLGPGYPISWIFTLATMVYPQELLRLVPLTFEQYLERSESIFLVDMGERPQLWHKKEISAEDTQLTEPTLNGLLISLGLLYTETDLEALIRDKLFDRQEFYVDLILNDLLPTNILQIPKGIQEKLAQYIQELGEEIQTNYNYFADQNRGPLRKELLDAIEEINKFLNYLKENHNSIQHLPPETSDILNMKHNLSKTLATLNIDEPDTPEDLDTYKHMDEMIDFILGTFDQLATKVITTLEQDQK